MPGLERLKTLMRKPGHCAITSTSRQNKLNILNIIGHVNKAEVVMTLLGLKKQTETNTLIFEASYSRSIPARWNLRGYLE